MNKSSMNSWADSHGLIDKTLPVVLACQHVLSTGVIVKGSEAVVVGKNKL